MYFYHDGDTPVGPFSRKRLAQLAESGLIGTGTLVSNDAKTEWVPYHALLDGGEPWTVSEVLPELSPATASIEQVEGNDPASGVSDNAQCRRPDPSSATTEAPAADQDAVSTGSVAPVAGWTSEPPAPWRRYGARVFDTMFNGIIGFFLLSVAFYAIAPATADEVFELFEAGIGPLVDVFVTGLMASLVSGVLIGATGATLGKWIFGIKVTRLDGTRLGVAAGLVRDLEVFLKGLGLGIPLVSLVTLILSYRRLVGRKSTSWDDGQYLVWRRPGGTSQTLLNIVGILLIVLMIAALSAISSL